MLHMMLVAHRILALDGMVTQKMWSADSRLLPHTPLSLRQASNQAQDIITDEFQTAYFSIKKIKKQSK